MRIDDTIDRLLDTAVQYGVGYKFHVDWMPFPSFCGLTCKLVPHAVVYSRPVCSTAVEANCAVLAATDMYCIGLVHA